MAFGTWFKNIVHKGVEFAKKAAPIVKKVAEVASKVAPMIGGTVGNVIGNVAGVVNNTMDKIMPLTNINNNLTRNNMLQLKDNPRTRMIGNNGAGMRFMPILK